MSQPQHRSVVLAALAAAVLAFVLYGGVLNAGFMYDDVSYVQLNELIRSPANLGKVWTSTYPPGRADQGLYRPVTATSYLIDHAIYGLDPRRFHLTNNLLHGLATFLVVLMAARFGAGLTGALVAGLLFASHAVHTEAVAWIVGRAEVLAGIGCFGGLLCWARYRGSGRFVWALASVALYFLGLGAKETGASLPAVLLLGDYLGLFPRDASPGGAVASGARVARGDVAGRERTIAGLTLRTLASYGWFVVAFAGYTALRLLALGHFSMAKEQISFANASFVERMAAGLAVVGKYISLMFLPVSLHVDYSDFKFLSFAHPPAMLGFLMTAGLIGAAIYFRRRRPHVAFWIGWFFLFVFVVSHLVIPIGAVLAERFIYIASAAACVLGGIFVNQWTTRGTSPVKWAAWAGVVCVTVWMSWATLERSREWIDPVTFYRTEVARAPTSEKAHISLAENLWEPGRRVGNQAQMDEAERLLKRAIDMREANSTTMTGDYATLMYLYLSHLRDRGRSAEVAPIYEKLTTLIAQYPILGEGMVPQVYVAYGAALEDLGKLDQARAWYERALKDKPDWAGPFMNLGNIAKRQGRPEDAVKIYRQAVDRDPTLTFGYMNLGYTLIMLNRKDEASKVLDEFLARAPKDADNAYYQGLLAQQLGKLDVAKARWQHALTLNARHPQALEALAKMK